MKNLERLSKLVSNLEEAKKKEDFAGVLKVYDQLYELEFENYKSASEEYRDLCSSSRDFGLISDRKKYIDSVVEVLEQIRIAKLTVLNLVHQ